MKHTKKYYDALDVLENATKYDDRDVIKASDYISIYIEGYIQAITNNV